MGPINDLPKSFTGFDRGFSYSPPIKTAARRKKKTLLGGLPRAAKKSHWARKKRYNMRENEACKRIIGNEKRQISGVGLIVCKGENEVVR
jgi:hypothetical protein